MAEVRELSIGNNVYDIESKSVVDQNTGKLKFWSGTKAEYDAQKLPAGTYYAWAKTWDGDDFDYLYTDTLEENNWNINVYAFVDGVFQVLYDKNPSHRRVEGGISGGVLAIDVIGDGYQIGDHSRDTSKDFTSQGKIDNTTLCNITDDDEAGTYEAYSKTEADNIFVKKEGSTDFAKLSSSQTFTGDNTFSKAIVNKSNISSSITPSESKYQPALIMDDKDNIPVGYIEVEYVPDGNIINKIVLSRMVNGTKVYSGFYVGATPTGADFAHATNGVKNSIVSWGMLNYSGMITFSANTPAPSNGFIIYNLDAGTGSIGIDGVSLPIGGNDSSNEGPVSLPLKKGSQITSLPAGFNLRFIPCIGG